MRLHPFTRRRLIASAVALAAMVPLVALGANVADTKPLRVGLTPAFVHDEYGLMDEWRRYLEAKLDRSIVFVQRDSYRETMDLIRLGQLDFAWICDYPFVHLKDQVRLLAVPLNQGRPFYRAYLIVGADDKSRQGMKDMKGTVFAFADPYSNTGYLTPRYMVKELGDDPARYFKKTFFTWSHRKAIEAVATGFAQGASVDGYVWDTLARFKPELTGRTRIIDRSPEYGFPPFVAHRATSAADYAAMQRVLIGMKDDPTGRQLLERLNIDGFVAGDKRMYDDVAKMMRAFGEY